MRRIICIALLIIICFVLQTTFFQALSFAGIAPNLMMILVSSFGFMRGKKEGMIIGIFCGLIIDIFCGFYIGIYALIYMYIGYINGLYQKKFFPDDIKLPLLLIGLSNIACNVATYIILFMFRGRFQIWYYLKAIIIPEFVYTMLVSIFMYFILLKINQRLEHKEKRRKKKFDL